MNADQYFNGRITPTHIYKTKPSPENPRQHLVLHIESRKVYQVFSEVFLAEPFAAIGAYVEASWGLSCVLVNHNKKLRT